MVDFLFENGFSVSFDRTEIKDTTPIHVLAENAFNSVLNNPINQFSNSCEVIYDNPK